MIRRIPGTRTLGRIAVLLCAVAALQFIVRDLNAQAALAELETGGSTLAVAAHSLGEMLMPGAYRRPVDGQPVGVEIAFVTRDVPASFAKAIAEGASPIAAPRRMPWGLEVAYVRAPDGTLIGLSEPPTTAAQS